MENLLAMYYVAGGVSPVVFVLGTKLVLGRILNKLMASAAES